MPRGVGKDFLQLLEGEQRSTRVRAWALIAIAAILFAPAYFIWPLWQGVAIHAVAVAIGLLVGLIWGARRVAAYEDSLRGSWNRWMDLAGACDTVPELARKVRGVRRSFEAAWLAAGLTVLWSMELLLIVMVFIDFTNGWLSMPVLLANGLVVGMATGHQIRLLSWTRSFHASLKEMVRDGEVGVWGTV